MDDRQVKGIVNAIDELRIDLTDKLASIEFIVDKIQKDVDSIKRKQ